MTTSLLALTACIWLALGQTRHQQPTLGKTLTRTPSRLLLLAGWGMLGYCLHLWTLDAGMSIGLSIGIMHLGLIALFPVLLLIYAPKTLLPVSLACLTLGGSL